MSHFTFLKQTIPSVHEPAARAEAYLFSDSRTAAIQARRALELTLDHIYTIKRLPEAHQATLDARLNSPEFNSLAGADKVTKANYIRKQGNRAAHTNTTFTSTDAGKIVSTLHHLLIWAAFNYSPAPEAVPLDQQFNLAALRQHQQARAAAAQQAKAEQQKSKAEIQKLLERFAEEDRKHAEQTAALTQEIENLRAQIAAAQRAKTLVDTHDYREDDTRDYFIDTLLHEAGWALDQPRDREYEVSGLPASTNPSGRGTIDYVLWGANGKPLAIVEAKRTRRSINDGLHQGVIYADALEKETGQRPLIFVTNGHEHQLLDDHPATNTPARPVSGFYTEDELALAIDRRTTRRPLWSIAPDASIAGRDYQLHAITAVGETFTSKKRSALLVMATGTGKTRTAAALIKQLAQANWVRRVLFLADRTALVNQASKVFVQQLPDMPVANLLEEKKATARIFTSTYPTMMNLIDARDEAGRQLYGPGFFDLIIVDEAHRSVYAKYRTIFEHFDALKVGLTATPKDDIAHNTYRLFDLEDGVPTDVYSYEQAVAEGHLVPAVAFKAETKFLREGIRYADLTEEEKQQWDEQDWGEEEIPEDVDAARMNTYLFNEDTIEKVLVTLDSEGHRVAGGDRLGKTIIFARSQQHADIILARFNALFPNYGSGFAAVITHSTSHAQDLIDRFSAPEKTPHVAISVDMLDTGIDVPDVVNLVFFKPVRSKSKYWQMIGRGTRLRPDLFAPGKHKQDLGSLTGAAMLSSSTMICQSPMMLWLNH